MRHLVVRHVTVYRYSEPVRLGEHRMMFRPRESHDCRLISTSLSIQPEPESVHWVHDLFDNSVAVATFAASASDLRFESVIAVDHIESPVPDYVLEPEAASYPFRYAEDEKANLLPALTRDIGDITVDTWARSFLDSDGSAPTMRLLRAMTEGIRTDFTYEARVARGVQTPEETLVKRRGSCRDFAYLMIDAARALGLAARFVSGYVFVPNTDGQTGVGDGATHAWLQVYLPGAGWVDFDPTNSIVGNRNLVRVAVAFHPSQVPPLWGTYYGRGSSFIGMDVAVTVTEGFSDGGS